MIKILHPKVVCAPLAYYPTLLFLLSVERWSVKEWNVNILKHNWGNKNQGPAPLPGLIVRSAL